MACFLQIRFWCAPLLAVLGLLACSKIDDPPPWEHRERPMMLFTDTTLLDLHEGNRLSWRLKTAYLERWSGTEKVFAKPILVDIYDSTGAKVAFLRADSGSLDTYMSYVNAYGRVFAITPKGASVRADSLVWNKRDNVVRTESAVRVVSEDGDVLQGKGFISDAKLENWQIQSNVTAIFQDAARRIKDEDSKQSQSAFGDSAAVATDSLHASASSAASPTVPTPPNATSSSSHAPSMTSSAAPSAPAGFSGPRVPGTKRRMAPMVHSPLPGGNP